MIQFITGIRPAALLLAALTAGCGGSAAPGGGGGGGGGTGANGLPLADGSDTTASLTTTFLNTPFTAAGAQATYDLVGGAYANSHTTKAVTVEIIDGDTIDVTIDGTTTRLDVDAGAAPIPEFPGTVFTDASGTFSAVFGRAGSGTTLQSIFFGYVDQSDTAADAYSDTFMVSGFETDPAEVGALTTTATYTGAAVMYARATSGTADAARQAVLSDTAGLAMTVNFQTGAVGGTISGATDAALGGGTTTLDLTGAVTAGTSTFSGTFDEAAGSTVAFSSGQFAGTFYGEDAEEAGGTFSGAIPAQGAIPEATAGSGFFIGACGATC